MTTKTGSSMMKTAIFGTVGAPTGMLRASNLTEAQKDMLREEYGLSPDANLTARNMGRGAVGDLAGSVLGAIAAGGPALRYLPKEIGNVERGIIAGLGAIGGSAIGNKLMTDKYSRHNVQKILDRKALEKLRELPQ